MMTDQESNKKRVSGTVVSDRMDKTISVEVNRLVQHDRYKKYIKRTSRFKAHDEEEKASEGDRVEIVQTRPLSKTKRWTLEQIIEKAPSKEQA